MLHVWEPPGMLSAIILFCAMMMFILKPQTLLRWKLDFSTPRYKWVYGCLLSMGKITYSTKHSIQRNQNNIENITAF